ncbi:MFS transporter [Microvirga puerhi]|uniref:MFS transporter n=1 Tax=Microvirga puerhi TaxID=2876078 RepID=A0ABS7VKC5_9HYPH|nr:MFS transporter [Microvirga puerhi]MBZ6075398.1 MFS transporter [Microvirga puerhi]
MSPLPTGDAFRLSALHAASFLSHGFYLPFFPIWLQSKALSPTIIGIIVAIPIIVRIVATAPLLGLADRSFGPRRLLLASHLGQMVGFPLLMFAPNEIAIVVLVGLVAIAQAAVIPGNDLVTTAAVQRNPRLHYGRMRGWGSVSFFIANIVAGYLVGAFGANVVLVALTLIPMLGISATLMAVPRHMDDLPVKGEGARRQDKGLPRVLWIVLIAAAMTQGTHGALNAFASIYWQSQGFADVTIGYFWAAGVIAEIAVFMILGNAVGRGSGLGLILLGAGAAVFRFTMMSLHPGAALTLGLQTLHSLTFCASHIGAMAALTALAPAHARGRAQGVYGSLSALFTAASTIASGVIYKEAGASVFAAMAPLGAAGFILILVARRMLKAQPQRAGSGG